MAVQKKTFEEAMTRLEEIVALLERGEAPLEASLKLFEEGTALMAQCSTQLDKAEQKVFRLTTGPDGQAAQVPLKGVTTSD